MPGHEKISFLSLPTPLQRLDRISEQLGVEFYIKRDDMTGLGMGGNKLRKLEYLMKDAMGNNATALVTFGGAQTNHGRLTAAVAAKFGLKCTIICVDEHPVELSANLLLDRLMGAEVVIKESDGRDDMEQYDELYEMVAREYESRGEKPYRIPIGGSNAIGMLGYIECASEIAEQAGLAGIDDARLFCAVGSMGTYMGLLCGLKLCRSSLRLTGIAILPFPRDWQEQRFFSYFSEGKAAHGFDFDLTEQDFSVETDYVGEGYNLPDPRVREAIYQMARSEGVILDPCYTGKAFAGIKTMIAEGRIKEGERVIFIHTGGEPGITTLSHRTEFERELMDGVRMIKR